MSVDTYLKGKNITRGYQVVEHQGVKILVAAALAQWAKEVWVGTSRFLFWRSIEIDAEPRHEHGPTCRH